MKRFFLGLFFLPFHLLSQNVNNTIVYNYEKNIDSLLIKFQNKNFSNNGIMAYRVQISFASTKNEINMEKIKFIESFPNIPIYLSYSAPYYKLRVGNYRTKNEAEKDKFFLIKKYPGSYIVKDIVKREYLMFN